MDLSTLLIEQLTARALQDGGFCETPGGSYRPDATAWAILALDGHESEATVSAARVRLAAAQGEDGRVCLAQDHPETVWPTPLALLAWQGAPAQASTHAAAVRFLLGSTGLHWKRQDDSPMTHDSALRGWPWVTDTYSWVAPTSLAVIALRAAGQLAHPRVAEARRLLLDRRIPSGGWNYGNAVVFGSELRPMPETTGMALMALGGHPGEGELMPSLKYLEATAAGLTTPLSLAWALLGLGAWNRRPTDGDRLITRCLERQERYGGYATSHLALLCLATKDRGGLLS